jgi:hypothetical protein
MSEDRLSRVAAAGIRAHALLEDEMLQDAFKILEERYLQAWRATAIDDVAARETLFKAIHVIGKVRDHLGSVLGNGRLAERELRELVELAERKRRFGIL